MRDYINDGDVKVLWGEDIKPVTQQAADIFDRLIPEWGKSFLQKNRKYKAVTNSLGAKGVFPDVNRKTGIIKDRIWDGNGVVGESTREVIMDLIGHLFLMLHMIDSEGERDVELSEGQAYQLGKAAERVAVYDPRRSVRQQLLDVWDREEPEPAHSRLMQRRDISNQIAPAHSRLMQRRDNLRNQIANARHGHRISEWEEVASVLASAADEFMREVERS